MSLYCQIGDLFVSYLKRKAKVKDTGNILPGHGGILDRVDGIIFAIPSGIFTYYILFFNSSL
jgi:phosphatidate cytidylyltransferase